MYSVFGRKKRFSRGSFIPFIQKDKLGFVGILMERANCKACVGVGEIPLLGEMSRSDKGVMAQP